jgi:hypothetical protein
MVNSNPFIIKTNLATLFQTCYNFKSTGPACGDAAGMETCE